MAANLAGQEGIQMDPNISSGGFWYVMTALVVVVTQILQTWRQEHQARKVAEQLAQTTKHEASKLADKSDTTAGKVDSVYRAVNGGGLGAKMQEMIEWQETHEKNDVRRFQEMHDFLKQFSPPDKLMPPASDEKPNPSNPA